MSDQTNRRPRSQINSTTVAGNLVEKPTLRHAGEKQTPVTTLTIANSRVRQGMQDSPNYFDIVVWGKAAEACAQYLDKGREVTVLGTLNYRAYEDRNSPDAKALGKPIRRTRVEIVAREVQWGGGPRSDSPSEQADAAAAPDVPVEPEPVVAASASGDIPF